MNSSEKPLSFGKPESWRWKIEIFQNANFDLKFQLLCDWYADNPQNNKGKNFLHLEKQHWVTLNKNITVSNNHHRAL